MGRVRYLGHVPEDPRTRAAIEKMLEAVYQQELRRQLSSLPSPAAQAEPQRTHPMSNLRHQSLPFALLFPSAAGAQTHHAGQPSDSQILGKLQTVLHDEHAFTGSSILPSVSHGIVTLTGDVRSEAEEELASRDLADLAGIKTVLNNLEVHDNAFKPALLAKAAPGPTGPQVMTLPPNTLYPCASATRSTSKAKLNDTFHGVTAAAVMQGTTVLIPAGTPVIGRVVEAKAAGHFSGSALLAVELVGIRLPETTRTRQSSPSSSPTWLQATESTPRRRLASVLPSVP